MTETPTPFDHPADKPRIYGYAIHADGTRLAGNIQARGMTAAMGALVDLLALPGIDEQATRLSIGRVGAGTLPDWDDLGPRLLTSLERCAWVLAIHAPLLPEGARIRADACVVEAHAVMADAKGGAR